MADHFIVMNPFARHVRQNKTLRAKIASLVGRKSAVIETHTTTDMLNALSSLAKVRSLHDVTVYAVGGDGTFNQVLNWSMAQPETSRPRLMPVGGGQFNFMAKHVGLSSTDPSVNLAKIFSGEIQLVPKSWKPIRVEDSHSGESCHAAVVGNGLLVDTVEWYEEMGKGDMMNVTKLIASMIADFAKHRVHGKYGRIKPTKGTVRVDGIDLPFNEFAAFMLGAVPKLLPGCAPFVETPNNKKFGTMIYWGGLSALAASVPMLWTGQSSPLTESSIFTKSAARVEITTQDPRLLIDGDLLRWPTREPNVQRTLTATYGSPITLLYTN